MTTSALLQKYLPPWEYFAINSRCLYCVILSKNFTTGTVETKIKITERKVKEGFIVLTRVNSSLNGDLLKKPTKDTFAYLAEK